MKKPAYLLIVCAVLLASSFASADVSGKKIFQNKCMSCHTIGAGTAGGVGPDLYGVMDKHDKQWLKSFIRSSKKMVESGDPEAKALFARYGLVMPGFDLSDEEMDAVLQYIAEEDQKVRSKKAKHKKPHVIIEKRRQPIDFSHKKHAGDNKIPCLMCHFGAEKSRHAGIPPANVCLNCHSQVKTDSKEIQKIHRAVNEKKHLVWYKRHDLQDHAYFNHSRHVNFGMKCQTCHGEVEKMVKPKPIKITMGWCVNCHRGKNENFKLPKNHVGGTKLDCARCHH